MVIKRTGSARRVHFWVLFQVESCKELGNWLREVVLLCFGVFLLNCVLMVVAAILTMRLLSLLSSKASAEKPTASSRDVRSPWCFALGTVFVTQICFSEPHHFDLFKLIRLCALDFVESSASVMGLVYEIQTHPCYLILFVFSED